MTSPADGIMSAFPHPFPVTVEVIEIAGELTKAQRQTLISSAPLVDGRILVPAYIQRKSWPHQMVDLYSLAFRRLTATGKEVRTHLQSQASS